MSLIDSNRMEALGNGVLVGQQALMDSELLGIARQYKKSVASRYRLMTESDIKHIEGKKLSVSLKLDGQLHFLFKSGEECFLYNLKGRVIQGLPLLDTAKASLGETDQALLVGELYYQGGDNRSRVYDVTSALGASGGDKPQHLAFAAFDVLEHNHERCWAESFANKQKKLTAMLPDSGQCYRIVQRDEDIKGISQLFKKWVSDGGEEGVICVDEDNHTVYKIKPKHNVDAVILGFTESPDVADSVRVLLTGLMRPDGSFQVFAKVGTGFDDEQRRALYKQLKAMEMPSGFNITDRNHTLFTMVRPEVVIEMAFHDLVYENAAGKPEMKPVINYDPQAGYNTLLPEPFVSVLGPVFKRCREDKAVTPDDLRLTQLQDFVDLDNLSQAAKSLDLANSKLIEREVYTKTTKGLVSVRKFVAWKTNKETIDSQYPAFVFCYVDFSPGRKDPLKRVVRIASSEDKLREIVDNYKANEIKRGWKAVEA